MSEPVLDVKLYANNKWEFWLDVFFYTHSGVAGEIVLALELCRHVLRSVSCRQQGGVLSQRVEQNTRKIPQFKTFYGLWLLGKQNGGRREQVEDGIFASSGQRCLKQRSEWN